jgi:magnesium transporter
MLFRGLKPDVFLNRDAPAEEEEPGGEESPGRNLTHKIALCVGPNFVITVRRQEVSWLDAIVRQVKAEPEVLLAKGPWVLTHRIIDVLTDRFLRALAVFERTIDGFEEVALETPEDFKMSDALLLKRQLVALRQMMREQRSIVLRLANDPLLVRGPHLKRYFKDIDDHAVEIIHVLDKQVDNVIALRDTHFAMVNVRLSDTMRVLAVLTTIAAPLNLLVGFYGMNFEFIPLLHNESGFWVVVTAMILLVGIMLAYFRRRRWI